MFVIARTFSFCVCFLCFRCMYDYSVSLCLVVSPVQSTARKTRSDCVEWDAKGDECATFVYHLGVVKLLIIVT